jgi:hypothetical protein
MKQIYVYLLDEGTDVWRPVQALQLDDGSFRIPPNALVPDGEIWEFNPGDIVRCKDKQLSEEKVALVAYEKA